MNGNIKTQEPDFNWSIIKKEAKAIQNYITENYGKVPQKEYAQIFERFVDPYFSKWDDFAYHCNSNQEYAPVVFCWFAKKELSIEPSQPLKIMRCICISLKEKLQ